MIFNVNWTEIVNLAGQMHNKSMQGIINEEEQNETARQILKLLHLDPSELIEKIGEIEFIIAEPGHIGFENKTNEQIDQKCFDLRYMITNVIGE